MTKVAIIYHSGYGHTQVQAECVAKGASSVEGIEVILKRVEDVTENPRQLNDADTIIFGSPTYMGSVSAPFKTFMDATASLWAKQEWKDKLAAGFTNSHSMSGDKVMSLMELVVFAAQHGMIWISLGLLNQSGDGKIPSGDPNAINRMGAYLGAMAQSENDSPEVTPPAGDRKTAELFGKRVAELALGRFRPEL